MRRLRCWWSGCIDKDGNDFPAFYIGRRTVTYECVRCGRVIQLGGP